MSPHGPPDLIADLVAIHAVITRGLRVASDGCASFARAFPEPALRDGFLAYVGTLGWVLNGHHLTEDDVAFPYFRRLMPDAPFDALIDDHRRMVPILDELLAGVDRARPGEALPGELEAIRGPLLRLTAIWHPHIRIEETSFAPETVNALLSPGENERLCRECGEHTARYSGPDFLAVPFMLYNLSAEDRHVLAETFPSEVTDRLVPHDWRPQWAPMAPFLLA